MELAGSILDIVDNNEKIFELSNSGIQYIHLDVMDNLFVNNYVFPSNNIIKSINLPIDIHLMVKDVLKYVKYYEEISPEFITFHYEVGNTLEYIKTIKSKNIKVGLAINPETKIDSILPYINEIDLILVMSVDPGYGGQTFKNSTTKKINQLIEYRNKFKLKYLIEVDGGINNFNIKKLNVDIAVLGNYITKNDNYKNQVEKLGVKWKKY